MNLIADVANQALMAAGVDEAIGDLEEGTKAARVLLRVYSQSVRQMFRAANWDFARKTADLLLLADASGQTPNVGALVPVPWRFEYAYPIDCMKVRVIPWNHGQYPAVPANNIAIPQNVPLTTGQGQPQYSGQRIQPARFVIATDPNYPPAPGQLFWEVQGESPQGRTVILTNVKNAKVIYTALMIYPSVWDPMFREAIVAYLAAQVALPLAKDKKMGMALRKENTEIAKQRIMEARVADGREGISSSDISVDWMRTRRTGGWGSRHNGFGDGGTEGGFGGGWDSLALPDGSVF